MLPTNLHKLPVKPESVAATMDGGALDLGAIPEHSPWGKWKLKQWTFQYVQFTLSPWMITVQYELYNWPVKFGCCHMVKFESCSWAWSSDNHSNSVINPWKVVKASVRGGLLEALFLLGNRREIDTNSWTCPIQSRVTASEPSSPSQFQAQSLSLPCFLSLCLSFLPLTIFCLGF